MFSTLSINHVGIVLKVRANVLTIQDGNLDGKTNTFEEATNDWRTYNITLEEFLSRYGGAKFAIQKHL